MDRDSNNDFASKATGVVTSVPSSSDSPSDYHTLMDLRKKPEFYGIEPSWASIDPVPVISTPTYREMMSPAGVKQLKIQWQKDTRQLAEENDIVYKERFHNGTVLRSNFHRPSRFPADHQLRISTPEWEEGLGKVVVYASTMEMMATPSINIVLKDYAYALHIDGCDTNIRPQPPTDTPNQPENQY